MKRVSIMAEELRAGDRLPSGDRIEGVMVEPVGPEWVVMVWIEGDPWGDHAPSLTLPPDGEVEVSR